VAMKACGCCWSVGDGPGYMAMCPCDGFTYVDHGGGSRPSLAVAPWETTVVLPPRLPPLSLFLPGGRGGDSGVNNVLLE
jgi:hypothetical protein